MNNSDMPAMPTGLVDEEVYNSDGEFCGTIQAKYVGLTKREDFIKTAMLGFISAGIHWMPPADRIAELSIKYADEVLRQMNKGAHND